MYYSTIVYIKYQLATSPKMVHTPSRGCGPQVENHYTKRMNHLSSLNSTELMKTF